MDYKLLNKSKIELDELYSKAKVKKVPDGCTQGIAIVAGYKFTAILAKLIEFLLWKGKIFYTNAKTQNGILVNKVTFLSIPMVVAQVNKGQSWFDKKDTIVIDYSKTSLIARCVRDEIREIEPGLFIGKMWMWKLPVLHFVLEVCE